MSDATDRSMIPLTPIESRMVSHFRAAVNPAGGNPLYFRQEVKAEKASAVLFLLGARTVQGREEPCLILNKRSRDVRQGGDLCCPGGGIEPRTDNLIARLLFLPFSPLRQWPHFPVWRKRHPRALRRMALYLATSLRESVEEMRLNPAGVRFIGPLPPQHLVLFQRTIYPMAAWITRQRTFYHNWEVEKVVWIPLRHLQEPAGYRRYLLLFETGGKKNAEGAGDYALPCYLHQEEGETEILWGATFRIAMAFLKEVFGFTPPDIRDLATVQGNLDSRYINGKKEG